MMRPRITGTPYLIDAATMSIRSDNRQHSGIGDSAKKPRKITKELEGSKQTNKQTKKHHGKAASGGDVASVARNEATTKPH